jgi:putative MATE family efflux protein
MKHRDNYEFLTGAPIRRVIPTLALPSIISMMVTSFYNLADTYFVSQINTQSTAAVGVVFTIMSIFQAFGFFFGHGSGNFISRALGAKEKDSPAIMAATGFGYGVGFGILLTVIGLLFLTPISRSLGSTATILPYTEQYLSYILLGAPFIIGSLTLNLQMRFQGNAAYSMYGIMSGAVLNIALDPLLIFTCGLGIRGAAIATVVSQMVSFFILLWLTAHCDNQRINLRRFSFSPTYLKAIFSGGTPSLTRQGLGSVASLTMNIVASGFGDAAIAAMTVVIRVSFIILAAVIGLGHGYQPLCGFCYGAKLYKRVIDGFWFTVKCGTIFLTILAVLGFIFAEEVVTQFRNDPDVIEIGSAALRWQLISLPFTPFIMMSNMMMQTINRPVAANLLAASRRGLFYLPALLILPYLFGIFGLEICQTVSDTLSLALAIPVTFFEFRRMKHTLNQSHQHLRDAETDVGACGIAEKTDGDTRSDDCAVMERTANDRSERR